ncbi:hypothetical protein Tco_0661065 [Tanacetum coccineum]
MTSCSQVVNKSPTHYPYDSARTFRVILFSIHNDEWKSFQCHHQTTLRSYALNWKPYKGDSLNLPDHRIHKDGDVKVILGSDKTKLTYGAAYTKLIMKVKKLENIIKSSKARRRIGAQTQGRHEHDLEPDFEFTTPKEVYTAESDISIANVPVSTAGAEVSTASSEVKTAAESLVYIKRSAAKRKDKGKAIIKEAEPVQKKTKLQLEQERLRYEEALRLQEQLVKE